MPFELPPGIEGSLRPTLKRLRAKRVDCRHFADHPDASIPFDCRAIVRIRIADHHDTGNRNRPTAESLQRQERVIDGAEAAAGYKDGREAELRHEIHHQLPMVERYKDAASTLDYPRPLAGPGRDRRGYRADVNLAPGQFGRSMRR
jgi:hypothetical protein